MSPRRAKTVWYWREPVRSKIRNIASRKPASPMRLKIIAFLPALAALGRSNQKAIRKYEQTPTPSQPRKVITKLPPRTSRSIDATNRFKYMKNFGNWPSCSM